MPTLIPRRALTFGLAAIPLALDAAVRAAGVEGLTRASESIHQEVIFAASRQRVYDVLTTAKQFDAVTRLSDGLELLNRPGARATAISPELGGEFVLFGGYITGRHLELRPAERLVQAWRAGSWKSGDYSIVNFSLRDEGASTRLVFDHRGFPEGEGASLSSGWHSHYWEPLAKFLA
jgi:activator of HSP90 ATPase